MKRLTTKQQIKRIKSIMNNGHMTTCKVCNFVYLALHDITEKTCPKCDSDIIQDIEVFDNWQLEEKNRLSHEEIISLVDFYNNN